MRYVESAILKIQYFIEPDNHGEGGREEMNKVCSKHTLTLSVDETDKVRFRYYSSPSSPYY